MHPEEQKKICLIPEPEETSFSGRWFGFGGFGSGEDPVFAEFALDGGDWQFRESAGKESTVKISKGIVEYSGNRHAAAATVVQLAKQRPGFLPEAYVKEEFTFKFRGFHIDIARGGVPGVGKFKELLRFLFLTKYNALGLYVEDLFPWKSFKGVGSERGRLTPEELREIEDYGEKLGIDVFPSLELLGHMEHVLSMPEYRGYSEMWWRNDGCIDLGNPEASELSLRMLRDVLELSKSKLVLIGGDETWSLGRGRTLDRTGRFEGPELYRAHYRKLIEMVMHSGKSAMMWGDMLNGMFLPEIGKSRWEGVINDALWNEVSIANWDYSPESIDYFSSRILGIGHLDKQLACPSLHSYGTYYPDYDDALKNIGGFLGAASGHGLNGFLITTWGDQGSECLYSLQYPLIAASIEIAEGNGEWENKWMALSGESPDVLDIRKRLGRKGLMKKARDFLYSYEPAAEQKFELAGEAESIVSDAGKTILPGDLEFAVSFLHTVCRLSAGSAGEEDLIRLSDSFSRLWLVERKKENLNAVQSKIWAVASRLHSKDLH